MIKNTKFKAKFVSKLVTIITIQALLFSTTNLYAAASAGLTSAEFLKIVPSPVASSMGGGLNADISNYPSSSYNNPASIVGVVNPKLSLNYILFVEDIRYHYSSFAMPTNFGTMGGSIVYMTYGDIQGYDVNFTKVNIPACYDAAAVLSYAYPIEKTEPVYTLHGAVGLNLKFLSSVLGDYSAEAIALDLGFIYNIPFIDGCSFGFTYKNVGSTMKFVKKSNPLPESLGLGLVYKKADWQNLVATLDMDMPSKGLSSTAIGVRFSPIHFVSLNAGIKTMEKSARTGLRAGIGLEFGDYDFNYAFSPFDNFVPVHHISFNMGVGNILKPEKASDYYRNRHFQEGRSLYFKKDYIAAMKKFEDILEAYPDHKPSQDYIAKIEKQIDGIRKRKEMQIDTFFKKAQAASERKDYIAAKQHYYAILDVDPKNLNAKQGLRKVDKALKEVRMEKIRQANRKKIEKVWKIAVGYFKKGDYVNSREKFKEILAIDPNHQGTKDYMVEIESQLSKVAATQVNELYALGTEYYRKAEYEEAKSYFEAVIIAAPHRLDAQDYIKKCDKKIKEAKANKAKQELERKQAKMKAEMDRVYNRGLKYYEKENYRNALKYFQKGSKLSKKYKFKDYQDNIRNYIFMTKSALADQEYKQGFKYFQSNKFEKAVEAYKNALKYDKNHTSAGVELERMSKNLGQQYYERGMKYFSEGNMDKAKEMFRKSLYYDADKQESKRALDRIK